MRNLRFVFLLALLLATGASAEDEFPFRSLPLELMKLVSESDVLYTVFSDPGEDAQSLLAAEIVRFSSGLEADGADPIPCGKVSSRLRKDPASFDRTTLKNLLLCYVPEEEDYGLATDGAARLSLRLSEVDFRPRATIVFGEEGTDVHGEGHWFSYALAKAAWRKEPGLRTKVASRDPGQAPTVAEELYALAVLAGAYVNALDKDRDEGEDPPEPLDCLDRLVDAARADLLRGYALYEVLHKAYGIPLNALSASDAREVRNYLDRFVLVPLAEDGRD